MEHHLNSKHPIDGNNNDDVTQPKASDFFRNKQARAEKYPKKHPKQMESRKFLSNGLVRRTSRNLHKLRRN